MKYNDVNYPSLNYSSNNYPGQNNPAFKFIILYDYNDYCLPLLSAVTILGGYTLANTNSGDLKSVVLNVRCFKIYLKNLIYILQILIVINSKNLNIVYNCI